MDNYGSVSEGLRPAATNTDLVRGPLVSARPLGFKLPKAYRLSSQSAIGLVFAEGHSLFVHPYRIKFRLAPTTPDNPVSDRLLVSVPKRMFKRAVVRHQIRRRIKEAWRLNHHDLRLAVQQVVLTQQQTNRASSPGAVGQKYLLDVSVLYVGNEVLAFDYLEKRLSLLLRKLQEALQEPSVFGPAPKPDTSNGRHPANRGKAKAPVAKSGLQ